MRKGTNARCGRCKRALPWNGGEWVKARELCPLCAPMVRREAREERIAAERAGQQAISADLLPSVSLAGYGEKPPEGERQPALFDL